MRDIMNGEVIAPQSVPVITLANVTNLTNVLRELPLPTPIEQHGKNKSLLFTPGVAEEARKVLATYDPNIAQQVAQILSSTNIDHIELKNEYNTPVEVVHHQLPELLKGVNSQYPHVFNAAQTPSVGLDVDVQEFLTQNFNHQTPVSGDNFYHQESLFPNQDTHPVQQQTASTLPQHDPFSQPPPTPAFQPAEHITPPQSQEQQHEPTVQQLGATVEPQHEVRSQQQHEVSKHQQKKVSRQPKSKHSKTKMKVPHRADPDTVEPMQQSPEREPFQQPTTEQQAVHHEQPVQLQTTSQIPVQDPEQPSEVNNIAPDPLSTISRDLHTPHKPKKDKKRKEKSASKEPVIQLQSITPEVLDKYQKPDPLSTPFKCEEPTIVTSTPRVTIPKRGHSETSQNSGMKMAMVKITKLDIGSQQYQVAADGLKIKIKKADGSHKHEKRKHSDDDEHEEHSRKKKKKHKHHKEQKSLRRESRILHVDEGSAYNISNLLVLLDTIIESVQMDELPAHIELAADSETGVTADILLSRATLCELINETAKLKSSSLCDDIEETQDRLSKIVTILLWNIKDGYKLLPNVDNAEEKGRELWKELLFERTGRSLEAALAGLYLMTAKKMPKVMYNEDLMDLIADLLKFQLSNTIYPEYDPVYDVKKDKDYTSNKQKRSRSHGVKNRGIMLMYNKICDIIDNLTDLVRSQRLTDTLILKISAFSVQPFFVENINELQLSAIRLVTEIFSRYEKHRQLILDDMLLSLARLPTTKRNIRAYRLSHEDYIQMMTALVLQLTHSIIKLPETSKNRHQSQDDSATNDVIISLTYEQAMKTAYHFLSVFLKKCAQKGEEDYRPLFDNFVNDLLVAANRPEWPAAELMLSMLGKLLVQQFSNKQVDMTLRVASLDYLGTVAARLRRDAVCTKQAEINELLDAIEDSSDSESESPTLDYVQRLQSTLLEYLLANGQKDPALIGARNFFIAQWYRDVVLQSEKLSSQLTQIEPEEIDSYEITQQALQENEAKKKILIDMSSITYSRFKHHPTKLDWNTATDVTKFLSAQRPFAQSFDIYLAQILKVLTETAVAVRTKAIKCLTLVIEADPSVLSRADMQQAVHARFLDQSTSVREACVELVGKFILSRPELIAQYYSMLVARILDTGISVRKRVIKIFRDVCIEMPNFDKIPDICVKMIRRVNDEEGIKKLVSEVFQSMWFTPVRDRDSEKLMRRVLNITTVMSVIKDSSLEFMEQLMRHLLGKESDSNNKPMRTACKQIVDTLVLNIIKLEQKAVEKSEGKVAISKDLVSSLCTLHLFSKIRPDLMVEHADTLQPYLEIKVTNAADSLVLHHTARILELVIPLVNNPRTNFLSQVEEDLMALILRSGMTVVQSAISCLAAVINNVTHNYALVRDCFKKLQNIVFNCHKEHQNNPSNPALQNRKPALKRSLFTIGVLCKHFDLDSDGFELKSSLFKSIEELVFEQQMYFLWHEDASVQLQALTSLGFFCIRFYEQMMGNRVKDLYHRLLTGRDTSDDMRVQVLNNLGKYLYEEEEMMLKAEEHWKQQKEKEDLKEMGDIQSGMASTIVQLYLKQVLESYFNKSVAVRNSAVNVVHLILKQGLIHPVQVVPYLIAMSTDEDSAITIKADQHLNEIDKKYQGFIHMKASAGIKMSYRIHHMIEVEHPFRGIRQDDQPQVQALNSHVYSLIRTNRQHRRALLTSLLHQFDDTSIVPLPDLFYMADNLAYFPYQSADEPLFLVHTIDIIASVSGSNLLQSFKENMLTKDGTPYIPPPEPEEITETDPETGEVRVIVTKPTIKSYRFDEDDDDDPDALYERLPSDCTTLYQLIYTAQGCILLLALKQHLKDMYGITEAKLSKYSPAEAQKVWERPINRRVGIKFNPHTVLSITTPDSPRSEINEEIKIMIIREYIQFRSMMMKIDPLDEDDEKPTGSSNTPPPPHIDEEDDTAIESFAAHEAENMAASMQPTISLMAMTDLPAEYAAQLNLPSTSKQTTDNQSAAENSWSSEDSDY